MESSNIVQIKSLVQFTRGTSSVWAALTTPIPAGVVVFSIDDGVFKLGDGATAYANLPTLFTFSQLVSAQGGAEALFDQPDPNTAGNLVVISSEANGKIMYSTSDTSLADLLTMVTNLETENASQDVAIANLLSASLSIDSTIATGTDGDLVVIKNGRYVDSGITVAQLRSQVASGVTFVPGSHVLEPVFYTTADLKIVADKMNLTDNNTYYVDVVGCNNSVETPTFGLTCSNPNVIINHISGQIFSITLNNICGNAAVESTLILVGSVDDGTGNATVRKAFVAIVYRDNIIEVVYGGASDLQTGNNVFYGITTDRNNDIIAVGSGSYSGVSSAVGLIAKFDNNLNLIAQQIYGDGSGASFNAVAVDSANNIICVGYDKGNTSSGLIVKFDTNLQILIEKEVDPIMTQAAFVAVAIDTLGSIFCICNGNANGTITKFDLSLNVLGQTVYNVSGVNGGRFFDLAVDHNNNVIAVGDVYSSSTDNNALVVKFDNSLNAITQISYGGSANDRFLSVIVDSGNNIICAGYTFSESVIGGNPTYNDALIVKFDPSLNVLSHKIYGGSYNDVFTGVGIGKNGNVYASGYTFSAGTGFPVYSDTIFVKFDPSLSIIIEKNYGAINSSDSFQGIVVDGNGHIICGGNTNSGFGIPSFLMMKLGNQITSGIFVGTVLPALVLYDSSLTSIPSTLATSSLFSLILTNGISVGMVAAVMPTAVAVSKVDRDILQSTSASSLSIVSLGVYTDAGCTAPAAILYNSTTYYCKIIPSGGGGSQTTDTYTLTSNNAGAVVTAVGNGIFSLAVGIVASAGTLSLSASAYFSGVTTYSNMTIPLNGVPPMVISSVGFFSDLGCTQTATVFDSARTYYAKIIASQIGNDPNNFTYTLSSNNNYATTVSDNGGIFSIIIGNLAVATPLTVTATAAYEGVSGQGTGSIMMTGVLPMQISTINLCSDSGCTNPVTLFNNNTTYYASVVPIGGGGSQTTDTYTLTSNNGNAVVTPVGNGIFKVMIGVASAGTLTLTGAASFGVNTTPPTTKTIALSGQSQISVNNVGIYSDAGCTNGVTILNNNTTYYAKVVPGGSGGSQTTDSYSLISNNVNVTTSAVGNGVFQLNVGTPGTGTFTLTATVAYGGNISTAATQNVTLSGQAQISISSIDVYYDSGCIIPVTTRHPNTTYFVKVVSGGGGGSQAGDSYSLTSNSSDVSVASNRGNGVFQVNVGTPSTGTFTLTATVAYGGNTSIPTILNITLDGHDPITITGLVQTDATTIKASYTGGNGSIAWSVTGLVPENLGYCSIRSVINLNNGTFSWVEYDNTGGDMFDRSGTYSLPVTVTAVSNGQSSSKSINVTIYYNIWYTGNPG